MDTYPVKESQHGLIAFEIENAYVSPRQIGQLLATVTGIENVRVRRIFSRESDVHLRFEYQGVPFVVWEPYGDNSRYWIGPDDVDGAVIDSTPIKGVFDSYTSNTLRNTLGRLLTLSFLKK